MLFRSHKFPSPQKAYASGGMEAVLADTREKDRLLSALGFNVNLSPVADVSTNPADFMYDRTFGQDAAATADYVAQVVSQMAEDGMGSVLKHFPGYGSAITDDHYGTSILTKTQKELEACDFLPFSSGIASGTPFVMVSHLSVPEVVGDETPSDLSSKIVSDLLRNKLGFTGVIITDSHQMASITDHYTPGEAAVKALQAGVDMILMPQDLQAAFDGVKQALSDGTLTQARIDESVLRILQVKAEYNILQ